MRYRPSRSRFTVALLILCALPAAALLLAQSPLDRYVVPAAIRDAVLNEVSGERAHLHVQMLAANRDRQAEEYQQEYFETTYIREQARQAGLSDVQVDFFPTRETWDAEEGDLWLIKPTKKKLASITMVPTALAQGSRNADVEAEVVYVGQGREADYAGKDVAGKIVLGSGAVGGVFATGVNQRGAAGALGTGSSGVSSNTPGYTMDQIGWSSVSPLPDKGGFGFALSLRQFLELRGLIDRGEKVVVRAHVRARNHPSRMNVVSAAIPGSDPAAGEMILVAHAFETIATPGANDNCTGVGTILEVGRALARLIRDGDLPRPRRTIRFVWGPEISGTTQFMYKHPELQDKLLVALNFDMTGANPKTTDAYLRMKLTPDSRPSYLNDLIESLLRFVDQTEIRTQEGANAVFNYRLSPVATITSGSDHSVFNNGGIPAMQFNYWGDNFYHSSGDRADQADATELKRVAFTAGATMAYLSTAGAAQARDLAWESAGNGQKWIAEVTRHAAGLLGNDAATLHEEHKAAQTKVAGAFGRAKGSVESVLALAREPEVAASVKSLVASLEAVRDTNAKLLETLYRERASAVGVKPVALGLTEKEREYSLLVPRRLFKVYSPEAQKRTAAPGGGRGGGRPQFTPGAPVPRRLPGAASSEVANFIDGTRSILDIYQAVRAECGNLVVGDDDNKFAYALSREAADVDLELVAAAIQTLEKGGAVEVVKLPPPKPVGKKK
ncbi:MAG: M28 family peptidase [Acidobacteria bacterium]|nr:MAG: M28 family peptidase [Acidobacteriota bacterium]